MDLAISTSHTIQQIYLFYPVNPPLHLAILASQPIQWIHFNQTTHLMDLAVLTSQPTQWI